VAAAAEQMPIWLSDLLTFSQAKMQAKMQARKQARSHAG
jgi:hypothetical protein